MVDPRTALFRASWQDEGEPDTLGDIEDVGAEVAIAWGRARSEIVLIRLGHRGNTYFSAGVVNATDDDGPMSLWPPDGPPPEGWWTPLAVPSLVEAEEVARAAEEGRMQPEAAALWAFDRIGATIEAGADQALFVALAALTSGWVQIGGRLVRSDAQDSHGTL
ncbi:MAG: hypothetical protein QOI08_3467 [Actinomycetota bacterium]|nr:hypothetical protein [Actinomycetota bacterium]